VRQVNRRLFYVAAKRAVVLLENGDLRGQNLSNVCWGFSTSRIPNRTLFREIAKHDLWSDGEFSSQHITNTLYAFSRIHGKIGIFREFFDTAAEAAIPKLPSFKTQELANLLWTFANQTFYHERLFAAVSLQATGRLSQFDNFDFSQLLWSCAKVWWRDEALFREAATELLERGRFRSMCAQDLGCVLWAFAMVQWDDPPLFAALAEAARSKIHTLKPLDVGMIAWALSTAGGLDEASARAVSEHVLRHDVMSTSEGGDGWGATAEGWVHVLNAVSPYREQLGSCWLQLEGRFRQLLLDPLCAQLSDLREARGFEGSTPPRPSRYRCCQKLRPHTSRMRRIGYRRLRLLWLQLARGKASTQP